MQKSIPWKNSSWKASGPGAKCPVEGGERSEGISQGPTVRAARSSRGLRRRCWCLRPWKPLESFKPEHALPVGRHRALEFADVKGWLLCDSVGLLSRPTTDTRHGGPSCAAGLLSGLPRLPVLGAPRSRPPQAVARTGVPRLCQRLPRRPLCHLSCVCPQ